MTKGLIAVGLLVLAYATLALRGILASKRIARSRRGDNVDTFAREFEGSGLNRSVLEMAYTDLVTVAKLPVRRNDDLEKALGLLPEEFELVIEERCQNLGVIDVWESPHASKFPLKTVEDYARFLAAVVAASERPV